MDKFILGKEYTRSEINSLVGGDFQSFLPRLNGQVVAGCFNPKRNFFAPWRIDIGKESNVARASQFVETKNIVPVFLKRGPGKWEYIGLFRPLRIVVEIDELITAPNKREDASGLLYLEEVEGENQPFVDVDYDPIFTDEGRKKIRKHLVRERKHWLIERKKQIAKARGELKCSVCGLDFEKIDPVYGAACCEVHHTKPLSTLLDNETTKLDDLVIICSNCHRMIHRTDPILSPEGLRKRLGLNNECKH